MSCLYELRIKPGSSGRAASALNSWAQSVAPWGFVLEVGTDCCRDSKLISNRLLKAELHLGCLTPSPQLREYQRKHMVLRNTFFLAWHGHYTIELSVLWLSVQTCSGLSPQCLVMEGSWELILPVNVSVVPGFWRKTRHFFFSCVAIDKVPILL